METDALQNRSTRTMVESFDSSPSCTEVITEEGSTTRTETQTTTANTIRLRLTRKSTKSGRRVSWTTDTVDNEMLNKKSQNVVVFTRSRKIGMKARRRMRTTTLTVSIAKVIKKVILIVNGRRKSMNRV